MRKAVLSSVLLAISIACAGCSSSGSDGGTGGTGGPTTALSFDADTALPATGGAAVATTFATQFGAVLANVFSALSGGGVQFSLAPKIDIPVPGFCSGGGTAVLDWNGSDLAAGDTVILTLDSCAGSPVSSAPASGTITLDMESVSGGLPVIGGIITATATLVLTIGDSPQDTISGSFVVNANLPNFTLANLTFGERAESDEIVVTEGGQALSIQCFDIFQRIGLAGPGIEFFRPLAVVRLGNEVFTMNNYEETPDNISFDFSTGAAVPIRGTIDLFSGIGSGVPCFNGVPEGDSSSSSSTFNPGGCVDIRGVESDGVGFGFSTFWDDLLDLDSSGSVSEEFCDGGTGGTGGSPSTPAMASPVSCSQPGDLVAVADAYVRGGSFADTKYGAAGNLLIKGDPDFEFSRKTYLVFDLSEAPADFSTATLVLTLENHVDRQPADLSGVIDNVDWNPNALPEAAADPMEAITWNNAPRNDTSSGIGFTGQGSSSASGVRILVPGYDFDLADPPADPDPAGTKYGFDVTDFVKWAVGQDADFSASSPGGDVDGYVTLLLALSAEGRADGSVLRSRNFAEACDHPFLHFE